MDPIVLLNNLKEIRHGLLNDNLEIIGDNLWGRIRLVVNRIRAKLGLSHFSLDFDKVSKKMERYFDEKSIKDLIQNNPALFKEGLDAFSTRLHHVGRTAVINALYERHFPKGQPPISKKSPLPPVASLTGADGDFATLIGAIENGDLLGVKRLLVTTSIRVPQKIWTLVHEAVKVKDVEVLKLLKGFYPKEFVSAQCHSVSKGSSILTYAIQSEPRETNPVADFLLGSGWKIENESACFRHQLKTSNRQYIGFVVQRGLDMKKVDENGNTFLHDLLKGTANVTADNIELFIKKGNPLNTQNKQQEGLIDVALKSGHDFAVELLQRNGEQVLKKDLPAKEFFQADSAKEKEQLYWLKYIALQPSKEGGVICNHIFEASERYSEEIVLQALKAPEKTWRCEKVNVPPAIAAIFCNPKNSHALRNQAAKTLWKITLNPFHTELKALFFREIGRNPDKKLLVALFKFLVKFDYSQRTPLNKAVMASIKEKIGADNCGTYATLSLCKASEMDENDLKRTAKVIKSSAWELYRSSYGSDRMHSNSAPTKEVLFNPHALLSRMEYRHVAMEIEKNNEQFSNWADYKKKRDTLSLKDQFEEISSKNCKFVGLPVFFPRDSSMVRIEQDSADFGKTVRSLFLGGMDRSAPLITHNASALKAVGAAFKGALVIISAEHYNQQYLLGQAYLEREKTFNTRFIYGVPQEAIQRIILPAAFEKFIKSVANDLMPIPELTKLYRHIDMSEMELGKLRFCLNRKDRINIMGGLKELTLLERIQFSPANAKELARDFKFATENEIFEETQYCKTVLKILRERSEYCLTPWNVVLGLKDEAFGKAVDEFISEAAPQAQVTKEDLLLVTEVAGEGEDQRHISRVLRVAALGLSEAILKANRLLYGLEESDIPLVLNLINKKDIFMAYLEGNKNLLEVNQEIRAAFQKSGGPEKISLPTFFRMLVSLGLHLKIKNVSTTLKGIKDMRLDWLKTVKTDWDEAKK